MDEQNDKALCEAYPNLYRDRHASMQTTCMCWGFDVGDGWYDIIDRLSAALECEILAMDDKPAAVQVKEKFGGLRVYMTFATDKMYDLIDNAEAESFITCEDCGQPGKPRGGGWIRTLCDDCNEKRNK